MRPTPGILQPIAKKPATSVAGLYVEVYKQISAGIKQLREMAFQELGPPSETTRVWTFAGNVLSEKIALPHVKNINQLVDHLKLTNRGLGIDGEQLYLSDFNGQYIYLENRNSRSIQSGVGLEFQGHIVYGFFSGGAEELAGNFLRSLSGLGIELNYENEAKRRAASRRELALSYSGPRQFTLGETGESEQLSYAITRAPGGAEHSTNQRTLLIFLGGDKLRDTTQLAAQISQRVPQVFTLVHVAGKADPLRYYFGDQLNLFRPVGQLLPTAQLDERLRASGELLVEFNAQGAFLRFYDKLAEAEQALTHEFFKARPRVLADAIFCRLGDGRILYRNIAVQPLRPGRGNAELLLLAVLERGATEEQVEQLAEYEREHGNTTVYICVRRMPPLIVPTLLRRIRTARTLGILLDERIGLMDNEHRVALYDANGTLQAAGPSVDRMATVATDAEDDLDK